MKALNESGVGKICDIQPIRKVPPSGEYKYKKFELMLTRRAKA